MFVKKLVEKASKKVRLLSLTPPTPLLLHLCSPSFRFRRLFSSGFGSWLKIDTHHGNEALDAVD
jgi:hypothetical protein